MADRPLTPKQARFVAEYRVDLNGKQAAIRAGYSAKGAEVTASKLLRVPKVAEAVAAGERVVIEQAGITRDRVLTEAALLSFSDLTHYVVDDNGNVQLTAGAPDGAMRAIQSIKRKQHRRVVDGESVTTYEVEIRLWDKPGPLKLSGQHVGLFKDKVEHSGGIAVSWED